MADDEPRPPALMKILLLGAGETGKSTILKQISLLYGQKESLGLYKEWLQRNTLTSAKQLVKVCRALKPDLLSGAADEAAAVEAADVEQSVTPELAAAMAKLWASGPLKEARLANFATPTEWVPDQAPYFLENATRLCAASYEPEDADSLRARTLTVGVKSLEFADKVDGAYLMQHLPIAAQVIEGSDIPSLCQLDWQMIDVGGQRNERRKWLHALSDAKALVWTAGLSEYQQVLYEDPSKIRMLESLELFEKWANNAQFAQTPIVVVFTKKDLFEANWDEASFKKVFPEWAPGADAKASAIAYLKEQFLAKLKAQRERPTFYTLDLTDADQVSELVKEIKRIVAAHNSGYIMDFIASFKKKKEGGGDGKRRGSAIAEGLKRLSLGGRRDSKK